MKKYYNFFFIFVIAFALSCKASKEIEPVAPEPRNPVELDSDQTFIESGIEELKLSDAEKVAQRFMFQDTKKRFTPSVVTRADQMTAVRDSLGNPLMYVVNFEQGGFCIVSATKKSLPILAHSDEGFFDLSRVGESGVCLWLDEMAHGIVYPQELTEDESVALNLAWREYEKHDYIAETRYYGDQSDPRYKVFSDRMGSIMGGGGDAIPLATAHLTGVVPEYVISGCKYFVGQNGCPVEYAIIVRENNDHVETVGPLIKTNWHQGSPYNSAIPHSHPAGCVTIAIGQIMRFHQHPYSYYNWPGILREDPVHLANFISDLGKTIGLQYWMGETGATEGEALSALRNSYNYDANLIYTDPINEISVSRRPYYAAGSAGKFGEQGHAWVCDGTKTRITNTIYHLDYQICQDGQYSYKTKSAAYNHSLRDPILEKTHINWGYAKYNTWYNVGTTYSPTNSLDFKYNRAFITAKPKNQIFPPTTPGGTIPPLVVGPGHEAMPLD